MKKKQIGKRIEAIKEELKKPIPPPLTTKEKKSMAKKAPKKSAKKGAAKKTSAKKSSAKKKGGKKKDTEGQVSLATLADKAGISGQAARQKLRAADIERVEGSRWSWKEGSKGLKAAKKALGL